MDDKAALANLAHAQSTLQAAELAVSDIEHGGTQDERNTSAADLSRATFQRQQDAADAGRRGRSCSSRAPTPPAEVAAAQHRVQIDDTNIRNIEQHSTQRYGDADRRSRPGPGRASARRRRRRARHLRHRRHPQHRSRAPSTICRSPSTTTSPPATTSVYVADLDHMRITAYFDEPDIGNLAVGQPVTITWEAKPGMAWHGHITQVPTTIISYLTRFVGECFDYRRRCQRRAPAQRQRQRHRHHRAARPRPQRSARGPAIRRTRNLTSSASSTTNWCALRSRLRGIVNLTAGRNHQRPLRRRHRRSQCNHQPRPDQRPRGNTRPINEHAPNIPPHLPRSAFPARLRSGGGHASLHCWRSE